MTEAETCGNCKAFRWDPCLDSPDAGRCCLKLPPHLNADEYRDDCAPLNRVEPSDTCHFFKPTEP